MTDLEAIWCMQPQFWGERDLRALHHPLLVHEFGDTALVVRDPDSSVAAYLFGFLTPARVAYAHIVAVRNDRRREGLGRELYGAFERLARERGAVALKAFTRPENTGSIEFHTSLGFSATEVSDYAGPGETRVVFWRELERSG
jgi:GNAT superfamily N-acetyltransferase